MSDSTALQPVSEGSTRHSEFYLARHLRFGWSALLIFLLLGIVLEALHGFKIQAYLNVASTTRRLMWTLAHAHGTLLALVNLAFAAAIPLVPSWPNRWRDLASMCLLGGSVLLPTGFFLGGAVIHGGDPGLGVLIVPVGALLLLTSVFLTAQATFIALKPADTTPAKKNTVAKHSSS